MRIIAGKHKGRQIKPVTGLKTRPTGDKIKEAIFHQIGPFFDGGYCLDLFAGSGSLGIEAMSRGMDHVVFIDKSQEAVRTIRKNIELLQMENECEIYRNDAFRALQKLEEKEMQFDLILLDPPYDLIDYNELIKTIEQTNIVKDDCIIYIEHRPNENIEFNRNQFKVLKEKNYNATTSITIIQKI